MKTALPSTTIFITAYLTYFTNQRALTRTLLRQDSAAFTHEIKVSVGLARKVARRFVAERRVVLKNGFLRRHARARKVLMSNPP